MSDWLFDLGNTRLKCAPLQGDGAIGAVVAIDHDGAGFASGWEALLPERIDAAFVCSVAAPALMLALLDALTRRCGRISVAKHFRAHPVRHRKLRTDMRDGVAQG